MLTGRFYTVLCWLVSAISGSRVAAQPVFAHFSFFLHLPFQFPGSAGTVAPSEGFAVALGQWGAAARRQDLRLTHTLADADWAIYSVAWAPDGRLAAGGLDNKVRVYDEAGSGGLGGWFLSYCATSLVLSCLPRCEEPCCWPLTASNPLQNETATIATADPGLKGNGFWTVIQTLQCCGIGPEVPEEVRCADEQVLHGALLVGFGNFWIKGCSATCVCAFFIFLHLPFQFPGSAGTVAPSEGFAVALRATGQWGAARRQDLRLTHTLADAVGAINSVAWTPDGRLAAGSDQKVRVYKEARGGAVRSFSG